MSMYIGTCKILYPLTIREYGIDLPCPYPTIAILAHFFLHTLSPRPLSRVAIDPPSPTSLSGSLAGRRLHRRGGRPSYILVLVYPGLVIVVVCPLWHLGSTGGDFIAGICEHLVMGCGDLLLVVLQGLELMTDSALPRLSIQ
jgi:hypothetical protein